MDFEAFLNGIRSSQAYAGQIVHSHVDDARDPVYADPECPLSPACLRLLENAGIERLYLHQARAVDAAEAGLDTLIATGTASGKSLCYQLPLLSMLERRPGARAILLHPTKALSQDQFQSLRRAFGAAGMPHALAGVFDGDTPAAMRRKLRDEARIILTNPDMLHAGLLPQHTRWAEFLRRLEYIVIDELHTYSGIFGSNAANLFRRLRRICAHYGSNPVFILCSATIGNPEETARRLLGKPVKVIDCDGSPRGRKIYVFWNPPRVRRRRYRSRRSANVEAQEIVTDLVRANVPTIVFSKAKITAELIYRYVAEALAKAAPHLVEKVTAYRGGYLPAERREIERRLFAGELTGVSTTPALELGIDVGGLDASVIVGYPGTLAGFFQQAGRAGRRDRESMAVLVAIDTAINQYIMRHPEYIFGRPIERIVLDPDNPYILSGHLRCAAYELPICESEVDSFGAYARLVLDVLIEQRKLAKIDGKWYHASDDVPQHEFGLRDFCDANVAITDIDTGRVIGELDKFDAQAMIHPEAIYIHQGETYIVLELDLERNLCLAKRIETDYYTQALGGTDVHHVDQPLRRREFGNAAACFGEVTSYFSTHEYERIHFYSLDAISRHPVNLPTYQLETMAVWITPSEELVREVIEEGFDVQRGLMGIGYATRMILPLYVACETLDFSHSSCTAVNAPWHTVFIYERYPHGLGFTEKAFEILGELIPAVYQHIASCDCASGCPCCVGKPLRSFTTWNIERGEASIPSKSAALRILGGIIGDGKSLCEPDSESMGQTDEEQRLTMERGIRRRLEKMGDPLLFHPIDPNPQVGFPDLEIPARTTDADIARRAIKRARLERLAESGKSPQMPGDTSRIAKDTPGAADADIVRDSKPNPRPEARALREIMRKSPPPEPSDPPGVSGKGFPETTNPEPIKLGDPIAARVKKMRKGRG